ncbi:MAG: radical SAM protein [Thermoanaerobaculia bacterium]
MMTDYEHCESLYWVFTQLCNDDCAHCYNLSGPQGKTMTLEDCLAVVANLPERVDRLILSGGEPLTERAKLHAILEAVRERYGDETQVMLQTNGDLLTGERLDALISRGVTRIDIASIDRFHKFKGERRAELEALFQSRGMVDEATGPLITREDYLKRGVLSYGFWGANDDFWLGGNWARGRAMETGVWKKDGEHNFCAVLSGGRGFLGGTELPQEVSIQLWRINPCCPGTVHPMGDARQERVADVLRRVADSPVFRKINEGDPYAMGETLGISAKEGHRRAAELGNVCLWCDEFFERHFDMDALAPRTEPAGEKPLLPVLDARRR